MRLNTPKSGTLKLHDILNISFVSVIVVTAICTAIPSFYLFQQHTVEQLSKSHIGTLTQISNNLIKIQDEIVTISDLFYHDENVNQFASLDILDEHNLENYRTLLRTRDEEVHDTLSNYSFDYKMQLIYSNGLSYSTDPADLMVMRDYPRQLWYVDVMKSSDPLFWLSSLSVFGTSPTENDYFSLIRKLTNVQGETVGMMIISVDERVLYQTYRQQIDESSSIYIVDEQGRIISHPTKSMIGRIFYDMKKFDALFLNQNNTIIQKLGEDYLFSRYIHPASLWITVEEIPMNSILYPLRQIGLVILAITTSAAIVSILLSIFIASRVSKPLSSVYASMEEAEKGNFTVAFPQKGFYETRGISAACAGFVNRILALIADNRRREQEKHKLELAFLQAQINPHFMYNTLFTIKCMVDMGYNDEACTMIDSFTNILKSTLSSGEQMTTLVAEMHLLQQYGVILQKRYKGLFHMTFHISPQTKDCLILRFLLQPIVENAVFHGFASLKSGGVITIRSEIDAHQLVIIIADNGCGMPQAAIDAMRIQTNSETHIGLQNVYRRIRLHYGESADVLIESNPDTGTQIKIVVPNQKQIDSLTHSNEEEDSDENSGGG